jgi:glycosyltransferase involved in cell wall biosynthesis
MEEIMHKEMSPKKGRTNSEQYGITPGNYAVSVCRIEPENNCHLILKAFATSGKNLVFVGNWERSEYSRRLKEEYCGQKIYRW